MFLYAILQFLSILNFFLGWSILKIMKKNGYFRYLFLGFKFFSLLGEYFDVPCWELRIDVSKSHTHKMIWFTEKIGYCLSRRPTKPFSQIFSLSALHLNKGYRGYTGSRPSNRRLCDHCNVSNVTISTPWKGDDNDLIWSYNIDRRVGNQFWQNHCGHVMSIIW